jgi:hypothetical protein
MELVAGAIIARDNVRNRSEIPAKEFAASASGHTSICVCLPPLAQTDPSIDED